MTYSLKVLVHHDIKADRKEHEVADDTMSVVRKQKEMHADAD